MIFVKLILGHNSYHFVLFLIFNPCFSGEFCLSCKWDHSGIIIMDSFCTELWSTKSVLDKNQPLKGSWYQGRNKNNSGILYSINLFIGMYNAWVSLFILLSIVKVYTFCVTNTYSPFGGPGRSLAAIDDVTIMDIPVDSRWLADTVGLWMGRGRLQQWSWPHHGAPCPVNSDHWPPGSCGHISNDPTRMPTLPAKSKLKIIVFFPILLDV